MSMLSERGRRFRLKSALTGILAKALSDAGIDAVDAGEFLGQLPPNPGPLDEAVRGRTLVAWDVDYVDPKRIPLEDHRGVLIVRFRDRTTPEELAKSVLVLLWTLEAEGSPGRIVVLEPEIVVTPHRSFKRKRAPMAAA